MIISEQTDMLPIKTSVCYAPIRAGKTFFAATFPRVAWIGSKREGGWKTILNQDPATFYERGRRPMIFAVDNMMELGNHLRVDIMPRVNTGEIQTICLELTFYADDVIRSCEGADYERNKYLKWDTLLDHIMNLDAACKKIPQLRLHYNAIARAKMTEKHPSGLMIPGQAAEKIPAMTDMIAYLRAEETAGEMNRFLHLRPYEGYPAGHRYGSKFPTMVKNPTFRILEQLYSGVMVADPTTGEALPRDVKKTGKVIDMGAGQLPKLRV